MSETVAEFLASIGKVQFYSKDDKNGEEIQNISSHCEYLTMYKVFPRQILAFQYFDSLDITTKIKYKVKIFSFESKLSGKRKFLVASWNEFFRNYMEEDDATSKSRCHHGHYYEIIREGFPCRPYFDLEYSIPDNPGVQGDHLVSTWIDLVLWKLYQLYGLCLDESHVVVLDSSTPTKFSKHIILHIRQSDESVEEILFQNNGLLGEFVESVILDITSPTTSADVRIPLPAYQDLWVNVKDSSSKTCFVDLGVYSRNRMFRIFGCTKYGKHVTLKLVPFDKKRYLGLQQTQLTASAGHVLSSTSSSSRHDLFESYLNLSFVVPLNVYKRMNNTILLDSKISFRSDEELVELIDYTVDGAFSVDNMLVHVPRHVLLSIPHDPGAQYDGSSLTLSTGFPELLGNLAEFAFSGDTCASDGDETIASQGTQLSQSSADPLTLAPPTQTRSQSQSQSLVQTQYKSQISRRTLSPVSISALGSRATIHRAGKTEWEERVVAKSNYINLATSMLPALDSFVLQCVVVGGVQGRLNGWTLYYSPSIHPGNTAPSLSNPSAAAGLVSKSEQNHYQNTQESNILESANRPVDSSSEPTYLRQSKQYRMRYQIANNRFCGNVGRAHKSNGIMIDVDLNRGLAYQLCWDPDCRGYRSAPIAIPHQFRPDLAIIEEYHSDVELLKYMESNRSLFG